MGAVAFTPSRGGLTGRSKRLLKAVADRSLIGVGPGPRRQGGDPCCTTSPRSSTQKSMRRSSFHSPSESGSVAHRKLSAFRRRRPWAKAMKSSSVRAAWWILKQPSRLNAPSSAGPAPGAPDPQQHDGTGALITSCTAVCPEAVRHAVAGREPGVAGRPRGIRSGGAGALWQNG